MASTWISYNELAWTEDWLAHPDEYDAEVKKYVSLIRRYADNEPKSLLHFGCGAGGHDRIFKSHFSVTGVDLSAGMLDKARKANPEAVYLEDDMRTVSVNRLFDAVIIPDSIDYMVTPDDLYLAVTNAARHLKTGGILIVTGKTQETFQCNNFAYSGEKDGVHVTLLENNHTDTLRPNTYEAVFVYLIRRQGNLSIYTEQQTLGLFPLMRRGGRAGMNNIKPVFPAVLSLKDQHFPLPARGQNCPACGASFQDSGPNILTGATPFQG